MEDSFILRPMNFDDLEEVVNLDEKCFPDPWSLDTFVHEITKNHMASYVVLVDENKKKIAGYAGMWIILDEAHITNVAVLAEYRGKKIGQMLMERQIRDSMVAGAIKMTLEARLSNIVAINLYKKIGFIEVGVRKKYYEDKEDAVIMWKYYEEG